MLEKVSAGIREAQKYTKFIVAVVGGLLTIFAGYIPVEWAPHIQQALIALTALSVYAFPNADGSTGENPEA